MPAHKLGPVDTGSRAVNPKVYRQQLYRLRSHPRPLPSDVFYDQRNSFVTVYLSLIPFLILEYVTERAYDVIPSGLVFPVGYLLFWAFYYTFYKPGFLEEKLSTPQKWDLIGIPSVLMGVVIWFVKVTIVELTGFFFRSIFGGRKAHPQERREAPRSNWERAHKARQSTYEGPRYRAEQEGTKFHHQQREGARFHQNAPPPPASGLPRDISTALAVLGLKEGADWTQIHRRYRELAKQFHPDLNRDITDVGRRFMIYDAAYRRLAGVRQKHFPDKRSHG